MLEHGSEHRFVLGVKGDVMSPWLSPGNEGYRVTAQMVLVCCWRSMKEVAMLLGQLCQSLPLQHSSSMSHTHSGLITEAQVRSSHPHSSFTRPHSSFQMHWGPTWNHIKKSMKIEKGDKEAWLNLLSVWGGLLQLCVLSGVVATAVPSISIRRQYILWSPCLWCSVRFEPTFMLLWVKAGPTMSSWKPRADNKLWMLCQINDLDKIWVWIRWKCVNLLCF